MKPNLAILLLLLLPAAGLNAKDAGSDQRQADAKEHSEAPTPSTILAGQLKDIVSSSSMSRKSQAKLVSSAVHLAVVTATQGMTGPAKALNLALDLATTAGKAAPQFADEIADAINGTSIISRIEGASNRIKEAVYAGKDEADETDTAYPERNEHRRHKPDNDFGGHRDDPVVSPSGPHTTSSSSSEGGAISVNSGGAVTTAIGSK